MPEVVPQIEPHTTNVYGVHLLKTRHRFIRKLRSLAEPSSHGDKIWPANFLLMDFLSEYPPKSRTRLMDLGCGWGLVGIHCALKYGCKVTCVDKDAAVFPFVTVHATLNQVKVGLLKQTYDRLTRARLGEELTIVGADICYWPELVKPLCNLVERALRSGVERIVIADPGRKPFYDFSDLCGEKYGAVSRGWYAREPGRVYGDVLEIIRKS